MLRFVEETIRCRSVDGAGAARAGEEEVETLRGQAQGEGERRWEGEESSGRGGVGEWRGLGVRRELSLLVGSFVLRGDGVLGDGVGFVGALESTASSSPPRAALAGRFFRLVRGSHPCPRSLAAQTGCRAPF